MYTTGCAALHPRRGGQAVATFRSPDEAGPNSRDGTRSETHTGADKMSGERIVSMATIRPAKWGARWESRTNAFVGE